MKGRLIGRRRGEERRGEETGGVVALHSPEQCYPQALALETAGTVIGLLLPEVAVDFGVFQLPEMDREGFHMELLKAPAHQCQPRMKTDRAPGSGPQLSLGGFETTRFAQQIVVQLGDLVAADDQ